MSFHDIFYSLKHDYEAKGLSKLEASHAAIVHIQHNVRNGVTYTF